MAICGTHAYNAIDKAILVISSEDAHHEKGLSFTYGERGHEYRDCDQPFWWPEFEPEGRFRLIFRRRSYRPLRTHNLIWSFPATCYCPDGALKYPFARMVQLGFVDRVHLRRLDRILERTEHVTGPFGKQDQCIPVNALPMSSYYAAGSLVDHSKLQTKHGLQTAQGRWSYSRPLHAVFRSLQLIEAERIEFEGRRRLNDSWINPHMILILMNLECLIPAPSIRYEY